MFRFLFVSLFVLCYNTMLGNGQCTTSSCKDSISGSEENLLERCEEREHKMAIMHEKLSADVNRSIVRGQEELEQNVKMAFLNLSSKIETIEERYRVSDCNCLSAAENVYENIESVNESLTRNLNEHDHNLKLLIQNVSSRFAQADENLSLKLQKMNESVVIALKELDRKFQALIENISLSIRPNEKLNDKLNGVLNQVNESLQNNKSQDYCQVNASICDCSTIRANGNTTSGVYRIHVDHQNQRYYANAFCDMTTGNAGWTVFQRRKDGSEDFYRGWNDYANGFGNPNGEYWLGNDFLHMLTSKRRYRLRIELGDFEGGKRFAEYSTFNISSAADKYSLRVVNYSGNAGDSLSYHSGYQFSTKDQDNDASTYRNCAESGWAGGAWWYHDSYHSNLNGFYYRTGRYSCSGCSNGTTWGLWRGYSYSLKSTEMKIFHY